MLCGQFVNGAGPISSNPSLAFYPLFPSASATSIRSPYYTLLTLLNNNMAALATTQQLHNVDDEDIFLENGLLSYENPNYHLDPARLDDALNSNMTDECLYDDINSYQLNKINSQMTEMTQTNMTKSTPGTPARRAYANLDIGKMGVDVTTGPLTNSGDNSANNRSNLENSNYPNENIDDVDYDSSHQANDNNSIPHITGDVNEDLYAVPVKRRLPPPPISSADDNKWHSERLQSFQHLSIDDSESLDEQITPDSSDELYCNKEQLCNERLPAGWEKHEDNDGPYYWHIKSGTIQREVPTSPIKIFNDKIKKETENLLKYEPKDVMITSVTRSNTSCALDAELDGERKRKEEIAFKRRSYPARVDSEKAIRFAVRSLGWVEISEDDLTPERSSKAVNKCIVDLSLGKNDLLDVVGRWGDGKDLFMDLDEGALKLIDPENLTVLNTQPIHTIRVWGVGRDNGRDFAYVARDRNTRKHMCHVFRCDMPARTIANTLRDICKRIMIERSMQQNAAKPIDMNGRVNMAARPTNLPMEHRRSHRNSQILVTQSFPTPMEEPKKILRAQYLGSTQVTQATGMDTLNNAIDLLSGQDPQTWTQVNVAVAPSMISIQHLGDDNRIIAECRVRYLSFLGIGKNVKQCAFIMHTAQDTFIAHAFHCEPSAGALCKTIEAACKLRYQKCLDAHPQNQSTGRSNTTGASNGAQTPGRSLGAALKSIVGSLTTGVVRRASRSDS